MSHSVSPLRMRRVLCLVLAWASGAAARRAGAAYKSSAAPPAAQPATHPLTVHVEYQQLDAGVDGVELIWCVKTALAMLASAVHLPGAAAQPLLLPRPCAVERTWPSGKVECVQEAQAGMCLQAQHNASLFHRPPEVVADAVLYVTATAASDGGLVGCGRPGSAAATTTGVPPGTLAAAGGACLVDGNTGRPVAGAVNVCPDRLLAVRGASAFSRDALVLDVVHELLHVLAFSEGLYTSFKHAVTRAGGRALVTSPAVLAVARQHFNCPALSGVPLEDNGGEGTANTHWEMRALNGELMVGTVVAGQRPALSNFTLALLEDSGWYAPQYSAATPLTWGAAAGCDFAEAALARKPCPETPPSRFLCAPAAGETATCTHDSLAVGTCARLPLTSIDEQCFAVLPYSNWVCRDSTLADDDNDRSQWGYAFGPGARCVAGGRQPWSRRVGSLVYTMSEPSAGCFRLDCPAGAHQPSVSVAGAQLSCPADSTVNLDRALRGWTGQLGPCPAANLCTSLACPGDCSGSGECVGGGRCLCWPGWQGTNCSDCAAVTGQAPSAPCLSAAP